MKVQECVSRGMLRTAMLMACVAGIVSSDACGNVIIDNGDTRCSHTGTWEASRGGRAYGGGSLWARDGATYTWRFESEPEGKYEVLMWWSAAPSRARAVAVSIEHAEGSDALLINQRAAGGRWNSLGEYSFNGSGKVTITASSGSKASTCADAVWFRRSDPHGETIVDNRDRQTSRRGKWVISDAAECHGEDSVWGSCRATFTWYFVPQQSGDYEVAMWWTEKASQSTSAPVDIRYAGGKERVLVNQQINGGRWNPLGVYNFKKGARHSVTLWARDRFPMTYCADAVKFTAVGASELPVAVIDSIEPAHPKLDQSVTFKGHGTDSDGEVVAYRWESSVDGHLSDSDVFATDKLSKGVHTISFTVQDDSGRWSKAVVRDIKVGNAQTSEPAKADFAADHIRGPVPFTVKFTNHTAGDADQWSWDFGDGKTSTETNPTHTYTAPGVRTVSLTASSQGRTHTRTRYCYIDVKAAKVENVYVCNAYTGNNFLVPDLTKKMREMGATETADGWSYRPGNSDMTYNIHVVHDKEATVNAFYAKDSHVVIAGHGNYGFGLVYADPKETLANRIDHYRYVDDDCLVNYSTDWVSTKVDGMKYGQSYPNWRPDFKDGRSAVMPYDFGDARGNPPYNYYLTHQVGKDPTHHKIKVNGQYVERFPDSGVPAWYSPQGLKPDPHRNPEFFIRNPDTHYNRFDCVGEWTISKIAGAGFTGEAGYMGYNYQVQSPGSGSKVATWTIAVKHAGRYEVLANWPALADNATNAKYTVHHAEGATVVVMDQTRSARRNSLGVFNFEPGAAKVQLDDNANGRVVADAVILRPAADPTKILKAEFSADAASGSVPLTVHFKDQSLCYSYDYSIKPAEWHWDFGDGTTSREQHPSHTYVQAGTYTVKLRVVGTDGTKDTNNKTRFIAAGGTPAPKAQFRASPLQGVQDTYVTFHDQSSGDVNQWSWDFGDGHQSNEKNPVHKYETPGMYKVRLTVAGPQGNDTETKENYVHIRVGECFTDNSFQIKPHYYSQGYSMFGMVICYAGEPSIEKARMRHARLYHGSCGSFTYFGTTFDRGIMYGKQGITEVENDTSVVYLEWYLRGYPDEDICERLNRIERIHYFYNFDEKPL